MGTLRGKSELRGEGEKGGKGGEGGGRAGQGEGEEGRRSEGGREEWGRVQYLECRGQIMSYPITGSTCTCKKCCLAIPYLGMGPLWEFVRNTLA